MCEVRVNLLELVYRLCFDTCVGAVTVNDVKVAGGIVAWYIVVINIGDYLCYITLSSLFLLLY